jgi:diguanylate cyclase (GGDEF)-like protein/PAS domain S-box-containing protein
MNEATFENLVLGDGRLKAFNDTVPAGILVIRVDDGRVVFTNRFFNDVVGVDGEALLRDSWRDFFVDAQDRERMMIRFAEEGEVRNFEIRLRRPDGRQIWGLASMADIPIEDEDLLLFAFVDITALKEAEAEISKLANHDALTGLPTLRLFKDLFADALARAGRENAIFALFFLDLDGFKAVNDTEGHEAGDHVLKEISKRFLSVVRETDSLARIGGDEFVLLAEKMTRPLATTIANRLVDAAKEPFVLSSGRSVTIGVSVGVAFYPANGASLDGLMKAADAAMYKIKRGAKGGVSIADP